MKTPAVSELRALVAEAFPNADSASAQKLTEAIVRATELAAEEAQPVTRDHLDDKLGKLSNELRAWMESKLRVQLWQIGSLILIATVLNHFWR